MPTGLLRGLAEEVKFGFSCLPLSFPTSLSLEQGFATSALVTFRATLLVVVVALWCMVGWFVASLVSTY